MTGEVFMVRYYTIPYNLVYIFIIMMKTEFYNYFTIVHKHNIDHSDNRAFNGNMSKTGCGHCVHIGIFYYNIMLIYSCIGTYR